MLNDVSSCSWPQSGGSVPFSAGGRPCLQCWSLGRVGPPQGCHSRIDRDFRSYQRLCLLLSSVVVTVVMRAGPLLSCV